MRLKIIGNSFTENLFKEISILTDQAKLFFKEIEYDQKKGEIFLPIERYEVIGKRKYFSSILPYKYDKKKMIRTIIIIKNIISQTENIAKDANLSCVTLLFGITIKGNNILLSSIEEIQGVPYFSLKLKVEQVNIEITDRNA